MGIILSICSKEGVNAVEFVRTLAGLDNLDREHPLPEPEPLEKAEGGSVAGQRSIVRPLAGQKCNLELLPARTH